MLSRMRSPAIFILALPLLAAAEDWNRFRGPNGSGVSPHKGFPVEFGPARNLVWRTPLRPGKSSPVLTEKYVFLTSYENEKLYTECFDRATGARLWERFVERKHHDLANALNHPAAISPVTDGENVYSFFKDFGAVSYTVAGDLRWQAPLGPFVTSMGLGAAPVLAGDNLVVVADQLQGSYIAAFDRRNGELRWKKPREEIESWGSPLIFQPAGAQAPTILTVSRGMYGAYTPDTGQRIATLRGLATTIVGSPILDGDKLYAFGYGGDAPQPFANTLARLDKNKDGKLTPDEYNTDGTDAFVHGIAKYVGNRDMIVTKEEWDEKQKVVGGPTCLFALKIAPSGEATELWRYEKGFNGVIPTPLLYEGVLYVVKNGGILTSFDPATGKVIKTGRVQGALGGYSSSPVAAEGRVYLSSEEGKISVLRAAGEWEVTQVNDLDEPLFATPALSEGQIYVRTGNALYRFGTSAQVTPELQARQVISELLAAFSNLDWPKFRSLWGENPVVIYPSMEPKPDGKRIDDSAGFEASWRLQFEVIRKSAATRGVTSAPFMNLQPRDLRIDFPGPDTAVVTFHLTNTADSVGRRMFVIARTAAGWKITHLHASNMAIAQAK
jgi:outer membrane protein assembly factor BamB